MNPKLNIRLLWIVMVCSLLAAFHCGKTNKHFIKKADELRKQVKTVAFIPVYIDAKDFFPAIPVAEMPIIKVEYPDAFRNSLRTAMLQKTALIDKVAQSVLRDGDFKFTVVAGQIKATQIQKRKSPFTRENVLDWQHNYVYEIPPEVVREIAEQHHADAVFFHYVQMQKIWQNLYSSTSSGKTTYTSENNLPRDVILYMPQLYDARGALIYGGERIATFIFRGKNSENGNGDVLISLEKVNSKWSLQREEPAEVLLKTSAINEEYLFDKLRDKNGGALTGLYDGREKY